MSLRTSRADGPLYKVNRPCPPSTFGSHGDRNCAGKFQFPAERCKYSEYPTGHGVVARPKLYINCLPGLSIDHFRRSGQHYPLPAGITYHANRCQTALSRTSGRLHTSLWVPNQPGPGHPFRQGPRETCLEPHTDAIPRV
jgi:hypothetical protein